jgi:Tol biopolymer transport system component
MKRTVFPVALILIFLVVAAYGLSLANPVIPPADVDALGTSGTLMLIREERGVIAVDMINGQQRTLYTPDGGHVSSAALSPDGSTLALTQSSSPPHESIHAPTALTVLPLETSREPRVFIAPQKDESLSDVAWSPDGLTLYFTVHTGANSDKHRIDQMDIHSGQRTRLIREAFAPAATPDGARLAFVAVKPGHGDVLASAHSDGTEAAVLLQHGSMRRMGRPRISPDGTTILLSAVDVFATSEAPFWASLLGVKVASAHGGGDVSYLWQVPIMGGIPEPLMSIPSVGLVADYSPDGQYIAFASAQGVFVQSLATSEIVQLFDYNDIVDVQWIGP